MRRKHLILASCIISALLLTFTFHVSADENVEVDAGASSNSAPLLDSYFWENYTLLPYIQSDGAQYIDTNIKAKNNLDVTLVMSDYDGLNMGVCGVFGVSNENRLFVSFYNNYINAAFGYDQSTQNLDTGYLKYYNVLKFLDNKFYVNNNLLYTFTSGTFESTHTIPIFTRISDTDGSLATMSKFKLYSFNIYDHDLSDPNDPDSPEVGYVRYYYPARSKFGDVIGLYDAVSKTFVTTATQTPFANPTGSDAEMGITANITNFILNGLSWIGDILEFAIDEPMIILFMAIGLCGVAFRWARRVVHF